MFIDIVLMRTCDSVGLKVRLDSNKERHLPEAGLDTRTAVAMETLIKVLKALGECHFFVTFLSVPWTARRRALVIHESVASYIVTALANTFVLV